MRWMALALLTSGCVLGEQRNSEFDGVRDSTYRDRHFSRYAVAADHGLGVVPGTHSSGAWLGMNHAVCLVSTNGAIGTDIFIDGAPIDGVVLLDADEESWLAEDDGLILVTDGAGVVEAVWDVNGEVVGGQLTEDGIVLLVMTDTGCQVILIAPDGSQQSWDVDPETCDTDTDIELTATGTVLIGGPVITELGPTGVVAVDEGTDVAADASTGHSYYGTAGSPTVTHIDPDGQTSSFMLSAPLVDLAARSGRLVALIEGPTLVELDPLTGAPLAKEVYRGYAGMTRLQLTGTASTLVLTGGGAVQFYGLGEPKGAASDLPGQTDPSSTAQDQ